MTQKVFMIESKYFVATVAGNVDNPNITDAAFRDFIRKTLPIVKYNGHTKYDEEEVNRVYHQE